MALQDVAVNSTYTEQTDADNDSEVVLDRSSEMLSHSDTVRNSHLSFRTSISSLLL